MYISFRGHVQTEAISGVLVLSVLSGNCVLSLLEHGKN